MFAGKLDKMMGAETGTGNETETEIEIEIEIEKTPPPIIIRENGRLRLHAMYRCNKFKKPTKATEDSIFGLLGTSFGSVGILNLRAFSQC
jgi:hypothetical protein